MQSRVVALAAVLVATGLLPMPGLACSSPPPPSPKAAFAKSDEIYLARLVSVAKSQSTSDPAKILEKARFEVLIAWKGPKVRGAALHFETIISAHSAGSCGGSVVNDPSWVAAVSPTGGDADAPAAFSDVWVFYLSGSEPYAVATSSRSLPINLMDANELQFLFSHPSRP